MMNSALINFPSAPLIPVIRPRDAVELAINIAPSLTLAKGTVLGQITSAASDVQTVTLGTGGTLGGTFTLTGVNPLTGQTVTSTAIPFNSVSTTTVTAALVVMFGTGNVAATGSTPTTSGGTYTITFAGSLANLPIQVMTANGAGLTGTAPTVVVAHTTIGRTAGTYAAYSSAVAVPPNPGTLSGTGTGGSTGGGDFLVELTGVNAQGETTVGTPKLVTLAATNSLRVAAISSLDTTFTSLNVYVNGELVGACACSAGTSTQTDFTLASVAVKQSPPLVNTAYTAPNGAGTQTARCVLKFDVATDTFGNITYGASAIGGEWGQTTLSTPAYFKGFFQTSQLTGLDAAAVANLGKLIQGTTATGIIDIT